MDVQRILRIFLKSPTTIISTVRCSDFIALEVTTSAVIAVDTLEFTFTVLI